ncbi:iron-containing alcohol dehydrogenase, partial [Corallococcus sp. AB049A]
MGPKDQMFTSPGRYVQGRDLLDRAAQYLAPFGSTAFIISDEVVWGIAGQKLHDSLKADGIEPVKAIFRGEASMNEIERLIAEAKESSADVVI